MQELSLFLPFCCIFVLRRGRAPLPILIVCLFVELFCGFSSCILILLTTPTYLLLIMFTLPRIFALAAALSLNVFAQTPQDFMPGTLVKLGVDFKSINIDPPGTDVSSLDRKYSLAHAESSEKLIKGQR
jgi:hypothetical protein